MQDRVILAAVDCSAAVSRVIRENRRPASFRPAVGDGQSCVVTVLVQGGGERPRKVTMRVPM